MSARIAWKSSGRKLSLAQWQQHSGSIDTANIQHIESLHPAAAASELSPTTRRVAISSLGLFTIVLTVAGLYTGSFVYRLETSGAHAQGEIIRFDESSGGSNSGPSYYPVVRFQTANDRAIEFRDRVGSNPPTHRTGDKVRVLYLESDPAKSMIDRGRFFNWLIPAILFGIAVIVAILFLKLLHAGQGGIGAPGTA